MRRREFIALVGAASAWPTTLRAQPASKKARIGVLLQVAPSEAAVQPLWKALLEGLREHGWDEGRNLTIETRIGGRDVARFPVLAAELAALPVDVILAANPHSINAARMASSTIPVIMLGGADPVSAGWVTSLARPGGNVTGLASEYETLAGKHLELLKELDPRIARIGVLYSPASAVSATWAKALQGELGPRLGLAIILFPADTAPELDAALTRIARERPQALVVPGGDPLVQANRHTVAAFAVRERLPTVTGLKVLVPDGLLMSYAHDPAEAFRRAAWYVDRILRGASAAELPVELMSRFELVINLKTARAIGLTVPPLLLTRADEVIE